MLIYSTFMNSVGLAIACSNKVTNGGSFVGACVCVCARVCVQCAKPVHSVKWHYLFLAH